MITIKKDAKDNVSVAMGNFALSIISGNEFDYAIEDGALFVDTDGELREYATLLTLWKAGDVKVEVSKMKTDEKFNVIGWDTILV